MRDIVGPVIHAAGQAAAVTRQYMHSFWLHPVNAEMECKRRRSGQFAPHRCMHIEMLAPDG